MTREDARWLACFVDTDGSISIFGKHRGCSGSIEFKTVITLTSCVPEMLAESMRLIGAGSICHNKRNPPRRKLVYRHTIVSRGACRLLRFIYPYLIVKKRQARCAIHFQERLAGHNYDRKNPVPASEVVYRKRICEIVRVLNYRGVEDSHPDISWVPEPDLSGVEYDADQEEADESIEGDTC